MGGRGSGTWYRLTKKTTVDECRCIDINRWAKEKLLTGPPFSWYWQRNNGERVYINVYPESGRLRLYYHYRFRHGSWTPVNYLVPIEYTKTGYGHRPWFCCPVCNKRCSKLYLNSKYFTCRYCANLSYESRNETQADRIMRKSQKIRGRLIREQIIEGCYDYNKPKGMHWRTFYRLYEQADEYEHMARFMWMQQQLRELKHGLFQRQK